MKKTLQYIIIFQLFFASVYGNNLYSTIPNDTTFEQADSIMKVLHAQAFKELDLGQFEYAEKLYQSVIKLKETYAPNDTFKLANVYGNYATLLMSIWKYEDANYYFDKALEYNDYSDIKNTISKLLNKGNLLLKSNNIDAALVYFDQAEKYLIKNKALDNSAIKIILENKLLANYLLNNFEDALKNIDFIESSIELSPIEKYEINLSRFILLYRSKKEKQAIEVYEKMKLLRPSGHFNLNENLEYATFIYFNQKRIDEAIVIYERIIEESKFKSLNKENILHVYNNLGNCYDAKNMHKEALDQYQIALTRLYSGFTSKDIKSDPAQATTYEEALNLLLFKNKAEVLYKYSKAINDTSYLSISLKNCLRSINVIQKVRYRITSDQSQFLISKKERYSFNLTQYVALEQYSQTKDPYYLNLAFEVNEKGRSFTLLSALRNQTALDFGNIPERIRTREGELNRQLSLYDELIYNEKQKADADLQKISSWEDQLFLTNQEYLKLMRDLERDYPEYYRLKFDEEVTDFYDIQKKIDRNTVLLEYSYMDSVLIIYTVSRDSMDATKVILEPGFEDKCIEFLNLITTQSFSDTVTNTFNKYAALAHELYKIVIEPVRKKLDGVNLIIIPDGAISYLPFDALITSKIPRGKPDYRHIPFLIKEYSVGYSYSSTLHFNPVNRLRVPSESVLAFAPIYSNATSQTSEYNLLRSQEFLDLISLPGATIEVNKISKIHKTDAYYNVAAKESIFKSISGRYRILHLAMHTMIDNEDPMLSRLVFTQVPDGKEDGLLHTYEIYNMKLNASLTVLSSCSSGYGKFQPGEGVQSLARGFAYAGCPSILMTLWEVADLSTVPVIADFYKYLVQHRTKPQALRESKLNFLADSDQLRSNPFFWASFVVIGDSSPIYPLKTETAAINAIMLTLPLGFLGVYYRKYKKKRNRKIKK